MTPSDHKLLEARLKVLLPEQYQDTYDQVQPVSMGSAGLVYGPDGRVAWDEIWGSFCDLAMAGGPPHRGTLLQPATTAEIDRDPLRYGEVVDELCRGIGLVTGLAAEPSLHPGWVSIDCPGSGMAGWLVRAITMENISARVDGLALHLPAGPGFRLEKEIKNVITSIAKTCHYWLGHTSVAQHRAVSELFRVLEPESPLLQPPLGDLDPENRTLMALRENIGYMLAAQTGSRATAVQYPGWFGIELPDTHSAVWTMRLMVASNVLCRRENTAVYVPVDPEMDPGGDRVVGRYTRVHRMARAQNVL